MPRPSSVTSTSPVVLVVFVVAWVAWCIFTVQMLMPFVDRHLVVYNGVTAWVLCMVPVLGMAIFLLVSGARDEQNP